MSKTSDPGYVESTTTSLKPNVAPEPAQHIPYREPQIGDEKPCPDCGKTWYFGERHICTVSPANRFDPFEALDELEVFVTEPAFRDRAYQLVFALRAYITGMER